MVNVVFDTNVLVAGLRSKRGASHRLLQSIGEGNWRLNISVALALEYEEVIKRPGVAPAFSETELDEFLDYVFSASNLVPVVLRRRPVLRDPDDECILELAAQCQAIIVTHNRRDFVGAERLGISVMSPTEFVRSLGARE